MDVCVLIPTYNPTDRFVKLVNELNDNNFKIIVVDDGSRLDTKKYFEIIKDKVILLTHMTNMGKGRALKTGFSYYLKNFKKTSSGIITVDSDGQHSISDIIKIKNTLIKNEYDLILGVRDFNSKNVPRPNKFGNILTRNLLNYAMGLEIMDTQTGLRGFSSACVEKTINVIGEGFEYEMNVLFEINSKKIKYFQIPIKTIYLKKNKSNFKKIKDSLLVYKGFSKFLIYYGLLYVFQILLFSFCLKKINDRSFLAILFIVCVFRLITKLLDFFINDLKYYNLKKDIKKLFIFDILFSLIISIILWSFNIYWSFNIIIAKIIMDVILMPFIIKFRL